MLNGSRLMSRAFVKDADYLEELPERPVSEHPNDVTEAGLAQIEHALAAASEAYADRAALAAAGRDLRYWSARRATARVVPAPTDHSEARFGTSVTIVRDDGREQTFRAVGEDEADPRQGLDLTCLAAGEIDVRKARRRRGQSRQRGSRDHPDPVTSPLAHSGLAERSKPVAFAYDHRGEEGEGADPLR
jgi:transcription elongation GreA/GreB family factor